MVAVALLGIGNSALAADEPAATPYRPSVSTPANLSAPGWLEMEFGWQRVEGGDAARQDSLPYSLKLAFSPDWGVRIQGNAQVRSTDSDGTSLSGIGDTAVILKHRFPVSDRTAFGLEAGINFPTAKDGLGSGQRDYALNGIYSTDLGEYHLDANLIGTWLSKPDAIAGRWQDAWAAGLSRPLDDRWNMIGEFSGTYQRATSNAAQFLVAASYSPSQRVVFDAGASWGLNRASQHWSLFAGVTLLLGKVF